MSIFFICIIASNARLAAAGSGPNTALVRAIGVIDGMASRRRLLDPVGNLPARRHDAFRSCDVIEQVQVTHVKHIDSLNV
jgi:hypothetical protein